MASVSPEPRWWDVLALALFAMAAGCIAPSESSQDGLTDLPGAGAWHEDVTCTSDADCFEGEVCDAGVCQMERCNDTYASTAPLGSFRYFGVDGEVALASDERFVDGLDGDVYVGSFELDGEIQDVAGGNLNGQRPQGIVVALREQTALVLNQSDGITRLEIGFEAAAVGAGDIDRDGLDEIVAFGFDGAIAICDAELMRCEAAQLDGLRGRDVTVGDVDGDGFAEPVFLFEDGGNEGLLIWNRDHETSEQDETMAWSLSFDAKEVDAGDVFAAGRDAIVIKHEGGWANFKDDKLQIFDAVTEEIVATANIHGHTVDVAVGDRDGDDRDEIVTLRDDHKVDVYRAIAGELSLERVERTDIAVGNSATRMTVVDWNGDSPAGRLVEGPSLVAGLPVPVTVMLFPPYVHGASSGALSAAVTVGQSDTSDETFSDSVSLQLGMTATFGLEAGPFKAKVSATLSQEWSQTQSSSQNLTVGSRQSVLASPDLHGRDYAAVVLSCGCYHKYLYETDDPAGKLGGSGKIAELMVPVGGQTQLWSSKRYNALAEALGNLPLIDIPVRVGDPSSYPTQPTTLRGEPVPADDLLFPETPSFQVSDVGYVGFHMIAGESETNEQAHTTTVGVSAGFGAFGSEIDVDTSIGVTQGYSISVGREALFAGSVPPVPDDPTTPEDEFALHKFSFTPIVYRERYLDVGGAESGYYVIHYWRSE